VTEEKRPEAAAQPASLFPEYQACQYHIQTIDMRLWQSAAILIGASFATLAVLAREEASTAFCAGLSLGALAAATIFSLWARIWRRRDASIGALEARMREIEWQTGMRKVIYFGILRRWDAREELDDWQRLSPAEQAALERSYGPLPRPSASFMLFATAMIALAGWLALAVAKTVELAAK
jgi:hypothetical protein